VGRPREDLPPLSDATLDALRTVAKPVAAVNWRELLTKKAEPDGGFRKARYLLPPDIATPNATGQFFLFSRITEADPRDFSVGLALQSGENLYRLVRCNGEHPTAHRNVIEATDIPPQTRHVHTATERYIKARDLRHDGFAEATQAYETIVQALDHLAELATLVPDGRMLL
jgi:hypothetical protein